MFGVADRPRQLAVRAGNFIDGVVEHRQRQIDIAAGGIVAVQYVQRLGRAILVRNIKHRAICHATAGVGQTDTPQLEQFLIDLQRVEAIGVIGQRGDAALQLIIVMSLLLLKVLWLNEQAFAPNHPILGRHGYSSSFLKSISSALTWISTP
ncbi:hypothetical protein D3C80_1451600 [compost metagenome]